MEKKKTAKEKVDKIIGIIILIVVGIFLVRYLLSNFPAYLELEKTIVKKIKLDEVSEKVARTLDVSDPEEIEKFKEKRRAERKKQSMPFFEIDISKEKAEEIEYQAVFLHDKAYYPKLKNALGKAQKSIYVAMFVIAMGDSPTDPVRRLLDELIAAKKRGVEVKVVAECPRRAGGSLYKRNSEAIDYLLEGEVEATFNDPKRELHDKFVLIDGDTIFLGNHNWSKQSLTINREVSLMVKSDPPDPEFIDHFAGIRLAKPEDTRQGRIKLIKDIYRELLKRTGESTT